LTAEDEAAAWLAAQSEQVIETSCARVYLRGDRALKVKKALNLGFLDFSTLAKRHWALERELAFNREAAPGIYLRLRRLTRAPRGGVELDGAGETLEWALEMRRFDEAGVLSNHPELVEGALAEDLGRTIARAHLAAPVRPDGGGVAALGYTIDSNAEHLRALAGRLGETLVAEVIAATDAAFARQGPLLEARRLAGFARRCHGDLHLGNILFENGRFVLFDCIEFNDRLSEIDIFYDLAFLLMDLGFRGRPEAANRVFNAYLDEAARGLPRTLWRGLAAMPLMLSARAVVRAHVAAHSGDDALGRQYVVAAARHLAPPPPRLVAVGGLSGTGKTTLARRLAPLIGAAPGALVLRSDEIRKRQAGVGPLDRLEAWAYTPEASARVYREMFEIAEVVLAAGRSAVLDAVFLESADRKAAETVAAAAGAPFLGLWLEGRRAVLEDRLAARAGDASDADARVLAGQLARDPGGISWRRLDAAGAEIADPAALIAGRGD
jgi:aminoglycoside phosphotransferase family enzyme/predicted kinase